MPTATITPVDVNAIKDTAKPWADACLARDWDALLGLCTDDVVFLPPDEPAVTNEHVRAWLENYPEITSFNVEFEHVEGLKRRDRVKGVGTRIWIETNQNVDEIAAGATKAGVHLEKAPYDTPWNSRAFDVTTPEGFALTISTPMT